VRGCDQIQIVFALQALLDDLHVQHAEEAARSKKAHASELSVHMQEGVVQVSFDSAGTKNLRIFRTDREQSQQIT